VVSAPALIEAVWDGSPPDAAVAALHALVSRVRRLGLPVTSVGGGYRLPADEVTVDAVRARALVDHASSALVDGDVAEARRCADAARALFPPVPVLDDPAAARLFVDAVGHQAEAALRGAGRLDVEDDLRWLAARADEPSVARLVRVLAAQGREAEALDAIETLRRELADRYGTDPSPAVSQVHVALLRGELAAAPAASRREGLPSSWRRSLTPTVGRERDVDAVRSAFAQAALVTIAGPGGAGKTRLAGEIARSEAASGTTVRVVELAGVRSADEVVPALLAVVGGTETNALRRGTTASDRLRLAVADFVGLVVLDNCEHVLAATADVVAELLAAAPGMRLLATSRAPLGVVGESVHRLGALPDEVAVRLLCDRARASGAAPEIDPRPALAVCQRLDNLPLAIELAAARLRHMPIDDVLAGLDHRFTMLDDALRGLPERHASLWAMVDWSHELLDAEDRALLQHLAVIPAPFTAELAAAVAGRSGVAAGLAALVDQSLLILDGGSPARYRMLETVREYGEARLAAPDREAALSGLAGWARHQAVKLQTDFIGSAQLAAFARCAEDQDNLIAGMRRSIEREDDPTAVDIAAALFHLWTVRDLHLEVVGWAESLLRVHDFPARRRSALVRGHRTGRELPDANRAAWVGVVIAVNCGITGQEATRVNALARRALRTLLAERAAELSTRYAALAVATLDFSADAPDRVFAAANSLIEAEDPLLAGIGLLARSMALDNAGLVEEGAEANEQAYRWFESMGDHALMGLAAQVMAQRVVSLGRAGTEWLRRSEHHLDLVGATEDVEFVRLQLDVQSALAGDARAADRLRVSADRVDRGAHAGMARIGLAQVALAQVGLANGRLDEVWAQIDAVAKVASSPVVQVPQWRALLRSAAATLALHTSGGAAIERAAGLLTLALKDALSTVDLPVLGACTLGLADLAVHRDDAVRARQLWVLATRMGANVFYQYQDEPCQPLRELTDTASVRDELAAWRARPVSEAVARIRELV
jgi:predicted ATPase/DNA-binding SARP family transcriptional activator